MLRICHQVPNLKSEPSWHAERNPLDLSFGYQQAPKTSWKNLNSSQNQTGIFCKHGNSIINDSEL